jgi:predicted ATPase/DNA-binding SARP family transcriptional activator/uncharacterized protein HemY
MHRLSISLLGTFRVALDGEPVTDFATDKARALLAYLVVEADRAHRRDALAGLLWPDQSQDKARHNLRQTLSYLRQALDDRDEAVPFLLVSRQAIQFNRDSDHWLDIAAFTALVEACERHRHRRLGSCLPCVRRLKQTAELYREGFLKQFFLSDSSVFEEWALLKREWFHREMIGALHHLTNYYERRGDYERAQEYAWRQITLEPWHEEAHRQLIRLLALDGQRSKALAQYEACCQVLADELRIEPTQETTALYESIRADETAPLLPRSSAPLHNLPPSPTPFVDREADQAELAELLANPDCRLVTVVGPGGIGKTRLALRVAADHVGAFAHGVAFVPFASVSSPGLFASSIADALGFSFHERRDPEEQLLGYLREKDMLLVLDSLEHILEGSTFLTEMLRRAPNLVLLVTSRERLNLREEWVYEVRELTYPKEEMVGDGKSYSAVVLFQQCARRVTQRSSLDEADIPSVVRICQLVEGIPLGVELAAAWLRVHSCSEIAREIERNLDILTTRLRNVPERHRSIRATFEHSWQLLSETEKSVLARLSVFRGGFQREAAAVVAGASTTTLSALLDKSLIHRASSDRYDIHGLLKQYAVEKLEDSPQTVEDIQVQYIRYFAAFLEQREERLKGARQKQALLDIALEIENARRAWKLAVSRGCVREIEQSVDSLYHFFNLRGRFREGVECFDQAIERWDGDEQQGRVLGKVMSRRGALCRPLGRYQQARTCLERSLAVFERLGVQTEQVFCLVNLADVARKQGKYQEAEQLAQEGLKLSRQIEDYRGTARSLFLLGVIRYRTGDVERAKVLLDESLATARESGDQRLIMSALNTLGDVTCHRGDYAEAQTVFEECVSLSRELDDRYSVAMHLNNLGTVLHVLERYGEARLYYEESLEICHRIGDRIGQAIALSNLGEVAHARGAYHEALDCYQEALSIGRDIQNQRTIVACLNNLGDTACALGDYVGAQAYLAEALEIATQTQVVAMQLKVLVNLAVLFAKQDRRERAAALLGLAYHHPASHRETQEKAERLLDEMELTLQDGAPRSSDVVVAEVLEEISSGAAQSPPAGHTTSSSNTSGSGFRNTSGRM